MTEHSRNLLISSKMIKEPGKHHDLTTRQTKDIYHFITHHQHLPFQPVKILVTERERERERERNVLLF
jgi:hypothetical protein